MFHILKKDWPIILILFFTLLAAILVYPHMPDRVPMHWNIKGEVDSYGSRFSGTFLLPLMNIGMYALFLVLPKLDPKKENYDKFKSSYQVIKYALIIFMSMIYLFVVLASLGYPINIGKVVPAGVSILFIILGNVMSRVKFNYFVGFRLPWTLANEEVWTKTHRLGAKLMVSGGFVALIGSLLTNGSMSFAIMMAAIFIPIIFTTIYSYVIFHKIAK